LAAQLGILLIALLGDRFIREPEWLWRKFPHPVVLFGALVDAADRLLNDPAARDAGRRRNGALASAVLIGSAAAAGWLLASIFKIAGPAGVFAEIAVVMVMLAQRSLKEHVVSVKDALEEGEESTKVCDAISKIVGRDPARLDRPATARAAVESLAENFSDGVVAPAFWYALFGLPGLLAYKMINTADSMIGHRNTRYRHFGAVSARIDDLANWLPARLSALLIAAGGWFRFGWRSGLWAIDSALRDANLHDSPNSGWPEAAMAGACDIALGGPRIYRDRTVDQSYFNAVGRNLPGPGDIEQAVKIYDHACTVLWIVVLCFLAVQS
jgi:adenosylcobinamide-phosphate synthase